jgi:hypothetical protein
MSASLQPLVRQGSMLSETLMADESKWRSADSNILDRMREGLDDLRNYLINRPSDKNFQKNKLQSINLNFSTPKGVEFWLAGVAGISMEQEESFSCTIDGLTAGFVDYATLCNWITAGDWRPNMATLKISSSDWSKDRRSKIKKLWIVTEVLYATKFSVTGRKGLLHKVMAQVPGMGVPGLSVEVGGDISVHCVDDSSVVLKAKRNNHFIVGYRTMRVEYNLDGSLHALRESQDTGLRGDDDDLQKTNLVSMEEDIFEIQEDGDKVPIPLLTPTEQELNDLRFLLANSGDSEGSAPT